MKLLLFCLAIYLIQFNKLTAQTTNYQLPPNQPEQDACNALQLCGSTFSTPYSYTGTGRKLDLDETPCFKQVGGGETNSVWLELHTGSAGNIAFKIKPVNPDDDYDFAVLNITGKNCDALTSDDVVRCNYNNNLPGSNKDGVIGLSDTSRTPYIQEGAFGGSFAQAVFAKSNEVYLIMINNYGNYVTGGPSKGFTIDFTGSTSIFNNTPSPQLQSVDVPCNNANSIMVKTSTEILCSSIAADGSDFTTSAPAKIVSASGLNCTNRGGYTNTIIINFSSVIPNGLYTVNVKRGSDNNTLTGLCDNDLTLPSNTVQYIVQKNGKVAIDNESTCYQQLPFLWHGFTINSNDSGKVYITKSAAGCDSTTVLNFHVSEPPKQVNMSASVCDGDAYVLPWGSTVTTAGTYTHHYPNTNGCDSVIENVTVSVFVPLGGDVQARDSTIQTGFCLNGSVVLRPQNDFVSYLWNTGKTSSSIVVNIAGAYSLIAKDKFGCNTIDTFVVARYQSPAPAFNNVENICEGGTKTLDAGTNATSYLWNNGSNAETFTTNKPGKFWVYLTTAHSCTATDTVNVVTVQRPANFLITSVTKCSFKDVTLTPLNNFDAYAWSNGDNTRSTNVSAGGLYWLDVTDDNGCTGRDSIKVIDSTCYEYFYMPNAFTPNNDYHNDIFKPAFSGPISGYHFSVYNRWGKLVFSTNDPIKGWDGTLQGFQQPVGVYIWICSYRLDAQPLHTEKGTVTLIR